MSVLSYTTNARLTYLALVGAVMFKNEKRDKFRRKQNDFCAVGENMTRN